MLYTIQLLTSMTATVEGDNHNGS